MPKLPHLSGLAIVKALERLGFDKLRQSGSHSVVQAEGIQAEGLGPIF